MEKWTDTRDIAIGLDEKHPVSGLLLMHLVDLRDRLDALEAFDADP